MFVLLLKSILEKNGSTTRCLLILSALFLFAPGLKAGDYQRTKDGKTLVWNNFPSDDDVVIWSGKHDSDGYATGSGTLTWYKKEKSFQTGSLLPGKGEVGDVTTYSGTMVHGKLNGLVNVDSSGRRFQLMFADGVKARGKAVQQKSATEQRNKERLSASKTAPAEGPAPSPTPKHRLFAGAETHRGSVTEQTSSEQQHSERVSPPAEGPASSPSSKESTKKVVSKENKAETQTESHAPAATPAPEVDEKTSPQTASASSANPALSNPPSLEISAPSVKPQAAPSTEQPTVQVASIRGTPPPSQQPQQQPRPAADEADSEAKDRMVADFRDETQDVLSQVGEATDDFRTADRIESVPKLPAAVSDSVNSLVQRARDFRAKVGYETAVHDYKTETETVDALSAVDQVSRNIASKDASAASAKLSEFLKSNPKASADNQRPLWQYLTSIQQLCSRSEKDANVHAQRAESFAAANRTGEAIREYQEAYRIFPNPAIAEKIRQLQANSLGL